MLINWLKSLVYIEYLFKHITNQQFLMVRWYSITSKNQHWISLRAQRLNNSIYVLHFSQQHNKYIII